MKKSLAVLLIIFLLLGGCGKKAEKPPEQPQTNPTVEQGYTVDFSYEAEDTQTLTKLWDAYMAKMWEANPEWLPEETRLTDCSYAFAQELVEFDRQTLSALQRLETDALDPATELNRELFQYYLDGRVEGEKFLYHSYVVNQFDGVAVCLPQGLADCTISSKQDARNYVARIRGIPWKLALEMEKIEQQAWLGILPPSFIAEAYLGAIRGFIDAPPEENILYTCFADQLKSCSWLKADKKRAAEEVLAAIRDEIYPAYAAICDYLQELEGEGRFTLTAGVWELPQGEEYYAYLVKKHTATNLTPEEIHSLGLAEVSRIQSEIKAKLVELGEGDTDPAVYFAELEKKDLLTDPQETLREYSRLVRRAMGLLPRFFTKVPAAQVAVAPVPSYREETYAGAAYRGAAAGQPGAFLVNLAIPHAKYEMEALAFHETVPGHHLQIGLQYESELPSFRTLVEATAYVEGWALYAEKLMYENGCYSSPISELGYLRSELFRAARLVIDTGIHFKRWTREEAAQYLWDTVGMRSEQEINRYIVWPGQALAYKVGELKILELREQARTALGSKFDLKEFHGVILDAGPVPLDLLAQEIQRYIEKKLETSLLISPAGLFFYPVCRGGKKQSNN